MAPTPDEPEPGHFSVQPPHSLAQMKTMMEATQPLAFSPPGRSIRTVGMDSKILSRFSLVDFHPSQMPSQPAPDFLSVVQRPPRSLLQKLQPPAVFSGRQTRSVGMASKIFLRFSRMASHPSQMPGEPAPDLLSVQP